MEEESWGMWEEAAGEGDRVVRGAGRRRTPRGGLETEGDQDDHARTPPPLITLVIGTLGGEGGSGLGTRGWGLGSRVVGSGSHAGGSRLCVLDGRWCVVRSESSASIIGCAAGRRRGRRKEHLSPPESTGGVVACARLVGSVRREVATTGTAATRSVPWDDRSRATGFGSSPSRRMGAVAKLNGTDSRTTCPGDQFKPE
jgi:hypothetical protein